MQQSPVTCSRHRKCTTTDGTFEHIECNLVCCHAVACEKHHVKLARTRLGASNSAHSTIWLTVVGNEHINGSIRNSVVLLTLELNFIATGLLSNTYSPSGLIGILSGSNLDHLTAGNEWEVNSCGIIIEVLLPQLSVNVIAVPSLPSDCLPLVELSLTRGMVLHSV